MPAHAFGFSLSSSKPPASVSQVTGMAGRAPPCPCGTSNFVPSVVIKPWLHHLCCLLFIWLVFLSSLLFFILPSVSQRASDPTYLRGSTESVNTLGDEVNPSQPVHTSTTLSHPSPALSTILTKQLLCSKAAPSCNLLTEVIVAPSGLQCFPACLFQPCLSSTCVPLAFLPRLKCHHLPLAAQAWGSLLCLPAQGARLWLFVHIYTTSGATWVYSSHLAWDSCSRFRDSDPGNHKKR